MWSAPPHEANIPHEAISHSEGGLLRKCNLVPHPKPMFPRGGELDAREERKKQSRLRGSPVFFCFYFDAQLIPLEHILAPIDVVGSQAECDFSSDSASRQLGFDFFPELVRVIFFLGSAPLVDSRRSPPLLNPLLMPVRNCRRFRLGWIDRGLRFCSWIDSRTSLIFSSWE